MYQTVTCDLARLEVRDIPLGPRMTTGKDVFTLCEDIGHLAQETFHVLLLDGAHRVIDRKIVALGTLDMAPVHPREVFRPAVWASALDVILVHNHPSGILTPSEPDLRMTEQLCEAGKILSIRVLDHVIVTQGGYFSFAEGGLLK